MKGLSNEKKKQININKKEIQQKKLKDSDISILIDNIQNNNPEIRTNAFDILYNSKLKSKDIITLENLIDHSNLDTRILIEKLLVKQEPSTLAETIKRLIDSENKKVINSGVNIVIELSKLIEQPGSIWNKYERNKKIFKDIISLVKDVNITSAAKKKNIDNIYNKIQIESIIKNGYGIYNPSEKMDFKKINSNDSIISFINEYVCGRISKNLVYKAMFEYVGISNSLNKLSLLLPCVTPNEQHNKLTNFEKGLLKDNDKLKETSIWFYEDVVGRVFEAEIMRKDCLTEFSEIAIKIPVIYGVDKLFESIKALNNKTLKVNHKSSAELSKEIVISHFISVSYPLKNDKISFLKNVSKRTLIDIMMYAPQWSDFIEECIGYKNLKSCCYYFIAYMSDITSETFNEDVMFEIEKHAYISLNELNKGVFDIKWFSEIYKQLDKETFSMVYNATKYIRNTAKHKRALKYTAAALKQVSIGEIEESIQFKRNKDSLMSYGIIPLKDEMDLIYRYEFLQKFLKGSKKFGSQKRASETAAVEIAMRNLAITAGYSSITRLVLHIETKFFENLREFFEWKCVKGYYLRLAMSEKNDIKIEVKKDKDNYNVIPAILNENTYVKQLKITQKHLKEQRHRSIKMFERSMENKDEYTCAELKTLLKNPIIAPVVESLIFVTRDDRFFIFENRDIVEIGKKLISTYSQITNSAKVRVAHSFDMYKEDVLREFRTKITAHLKNSANSKQPFKQVYRELYTKLYAELDEFETKMYSNCCLIKKDAIQCLKPRKWVADCFDGLQKVFYNENIIATIKSTGTSWTESEENNSITIERIFFIDKKTLKKIAIKDVPDVIYSEVMRDIDMTVIIAHDKEINPATMKVFAQMLNDQKKYKFNIIHHRK